VTAKSYRKVSVWPIDLHFGEALNHCEGQSHRKVAAQSFQPKRFLRAHGGGVAGQRPSFRVKPFRRAALLEQPAKGALIMQRVDRPAVSGACCVGSSIACGMQASSATIPSIAAFGRKAAIHRD
jgi:hypothetical protein